MPLMLVLLLIVPLLWPAVPPLIDLPGHIGRYRVQLAGGDSPSLHLWFTYRWALTGNLGVDLLVQWLGPILGIEPTVKLAVVAIVVLTASGILWISKELHGYITPYALLALPLVYNYTLNFGFVNYCLSMGFALVGFAWWLRFHRMNQRRLRFVIFLLFSPLVWIIHVYGWAVLTILCSGFELSNVLQISRSLSFRTKQFAKFLSQFLITCLPLAPPIVLIVLWRQKTSSAMSDFLDFLLIGKWLLFILRDRWIWLDLASALLIYGVIISALLGRISLGIHRGLRISLAILCACVLLLPHVLFNSAFASTRLIPYAVALTLISVKPRLSPTSVERERLYLAGALLFIGIRMASQTVSYFLFDQTWREVLSTLDYIERGKRVVSFVQLSCGTNWNNGRLFHLPSFAIARKDAFSNDQWAAVGAQLIQVHYAAAKEFSRDPSEQVTILTCPSVPRTLRDALNNFPRPAFDYLWLIGVPPANWPRDAGLRLRYNNSTSALFVIRQTPVNDVRRLREYGRGQGDQQRAPD